MKIYRNKSNDPYFNLAAEQYLLENTDGDVFTLWRNNRAVVIGKNQNAFAEINRDYIDKNDIKLVRRLTGGGAVYHDLGNICFTFITDSKDDEVIDFKRFTMPIIEALNELGFNAVLSGRNDIEVNGAKVSGNAQCVYSFVKNGKPVKKTMHHGTLLHNTNLTVLTGALNVNPEKMKAKGITSVRSRVANLREIADETGICKDMQTVYLMNYLEKYAVKRFSGSVLDYKAEQTAAISKLANEKYSRWDYNYGKSQTHETFKSKYYQFGYVEVSVCAQHGIIQSCTINGDFFGNGNINDFCETLIGCRVTRDDIMGRILSNEQDVGYYIYGASDADIVELLI